MQQYFIASEIHREQQKAADASVVNFHADADSAHVLYLLCTFQRVEFHSRQGPFTDAHF